ncbi:MAG: hypothetical protein IJJ40_02510 [Clostridia bacterium]|nr:hypothetical protein [Clostridia bacterium]
MARDNKTKNSIFAITVLTETICVALLIFLIFATKFFPKTHKAVIKYYTSHILEETSADELLERIKDEI